MMVGFLRFMCAVMILAGIYFFLEAVTRAGPLAGLLVTFGLYVSGSAFTAAIAFGWMASVLETLRRTQDLTAQLATAFVLRSAPPAKQAPPPSSPLDPPAAPERRKTSLADLAAEARGEMPPLGAQPTGGFPIIGNRGLVAKAEDRPSGPHRMEG